MSVKRIARGVHQRVHQNGVCRGDCKPEVFLAETHPGPDRFWIQVGRRCSGNAASPDHNYLPPG